LDQFNENLAQTIDLSQQIIELGKQGEWEQVQALDGKRLSLLRTLFSDKTSDAQRGKFQEQIERLLRLNEEAVAICTQARSASMANSRAAKRGAQAISAYRKQSGGS
jgi:hypothetical protein